MTGEMVAFKSKVIYEVYKEKLYKIGVAYIWLNQQETNTNELVYLLKYNVIISRGKNNFRIYEK
jgi:hypothetical protein